MIAQENEHYISLDYNVKAKIPSSRQDFLDSSFSC
jgi:hypothetical protein